MKNKILEYVRSLGISEVGAAGDMKSYSAIVCLFPYFTGYKEGANLSLYTHPEDYHKIVSGYLTKTAEYIKSLAPSAALSIHADNHSGDDRKMAHTAGLGIYGKNSLLINKRYGSYVFIGYVLTDILLPPDNPIEGTCLLCGECIRHCPGGALSERFCPSKCASHISQKKGELTYREEEILRKSALIFGCDMCQKVCPMNEGVCDTPLPEFRKNLKHTLSLSEIENLSEREFKRKFGNRAFSWRGGKILKRNLNILDGMK